MISSEKLKDRLRLRCLMSLKWCCPVHLESLRIEIYTCNCILYHDWILSTNDIFYPIQTHFRICSVRWQWVKSWNFSTIKYVNKINSNTHLQYFYLVNFFFNFHKNTIKFKQMKHFTVVKRKKNDNNS